MLSEPRTISLISEFVHVPVNHSADKLRAVYNEVCNSCGYEDFTRLQGGAQIERRDPESQSFSRLKLLRERIQITEDHTGVTVEQFAKKATAVLSSVLPQLEIPVLLVQQNTVRVISTPNNYGSAAEYLARSVFKIDEEQLQSFGRPTSLFGFRLVFPMAKGHPENFNVRVESYVRDPQALYIENVGTFKTPIQHSTLQTVENNLNLTSDFIGDRVVHFLSHYDRREAE